MNPMLVWWAENLVLVLSIAWGLSALFVTLGSVGLWRAARRFRRPPRPYVKLALSLIGVVAGILGVLFFTDGLRTVVPAARAQSRMLDQAAPPLPFVHVENETPGRLADYRGRVVLVNVWATWCPPCREEMPYLDELQRIHGPSGLVVLQISDEDRETVSRYLEKYPMSTVHGVAQPIPWPELGRPTSFVVDREGRVRKVMTGARDRGQFERAILPYL